MAKQDITKLLRIVARKDTTMALRFGTLRKFRRQFHSSLHHNGEESNLRTKVIFCKVLHHGGGTSLSILL